MAEDGRARGRDGSGGSLHERSQRGKRALAICTVSDHILHHEATTAEERQNGFTQMMELALKTSVKLEK